MRVSRIDQLEQYILENRTAANEALCEKFKISKNTLRRDLEILVARGTVEKVYGGVIACENALSNFNLVKFNIRAGRNAQSKERIAALAASFVREKDVIFIDSGTTTMNIVDRLDHLSAVTVITNSLQVINKSMDYPNINLIVLPGTLKRDTSSLVGSSCVEYLENYNIVRSFMACTGISLQAGVCNATMEEYIIKKTVLKKSQKHYLLADSSKFGCTSLMTFGEIGQFDYILTEQMPGDDFSTCCRDLGCTIEITPEL